MSLEELFGPVIHTYPRSQAIADEVLVDVTTTAREAGFTCPVALSSAAWADVVEWDTNNGACQDQEGRLWDVLTMARHAIWRAAQDPSADKSSTLFQLVRVPNTPRATVPRLATLRLVAGPGDAGELVITILTPTED